ncbi:GNAT family N-acetyltransferase [Streptomyces tropicalis]|uniref:GNAT family N-acetyltransferase n=1 Tax=Streptomyces tropicalis TaxID=3034234 RepID=A0ABT5ZY65_9ACTN|nr:GNAT family N-acetyltransferase [Streptomyces tropicalis]MDF3297323.1 GNAT family N-acetyltransferase [Streptomyces tropicalis]
MDEASGGQVRLEPWSEDDRRLLRLLNSAEMTAHLGGPETEEQLAARHRRYLGLAAGRMYRVVSADEGDTVGSVGFWEREWQGRTVWEAGWGVLPVFQGRGFAVRAARAVAGAARAAGRHRYLHAYPGEEHAASNAVCRRAGFTLRGPVRFEYPKGHWIRSNDWRLDLAP